MPDEKGHIRPQPDNKPMMYTGQYPGARPKVLAVTGDTFALREIRLVMPLSNLKRQGLIEDYLITDELLSDLPDEYQFDVVWLQRVCNHMLIEHLANRIDSNYLYDIDDLLIGNPSYTRIIYGVNPAALIALRECSTITATSQRLLGLLEEYSELPLKAKAIICPNGFEFSRSLRRPQVPEGLIWSSSDYAALIDSKDLVMNAIAEFSEKYDLPIYYFGYLDN
ncbi:MAG: hypothetical protein GY841_13930, partial [FCB group bacterium]|nr:hypothetical protein [FCB group bacterium]